MTDRQSFLQRWSRLKREAAAPEAAAPPAAAETDGAPLATAARACASEFDPARLPPIESITAATDVRPFLAPEVPPELRDAALRRAWSVDSTIRDYVGPQENAWNFEDPTGVPGFGPLPPDYDVEAAVRRLFGETSDANAETSDANPARPIAGQETETPASEQHALDVEENEALAKCAKAAVESNPAGSSASAQPSSPESITSADRDDNVVQCKNPFVLQPARSEVVSSRPSSRRRHGGALPKA